jgi:hypothetical protein
MAIEIAHNLRKTVITAFRTQAGEIPELGLEILCALLGLLSLVDQVGVITGAFFVVAYLLGLYAICTVRLLAVALDLPPPTY